ncbi:putative DNA-binding domain-containing protein [uncultured Paraglaciecola sp.]|uniref:HvfC family RiPP maturation protein n=1 Tax=uncultured Paraglaciecola sp. TaxID=1765024 RepID=UPI002634F564|nr:putative DNA-binding domain-containing protein [uncultured Paraglaciecola sp.]
MTSFKDTQQAFIQHIKNPQAHPKVTGIEDRRLKVYRELFFNNILGFLSAGFPVLKSVYSESQWQALARKFFSEHSCRSPYFIDISKEFVEYLSSEFELTASDPVFMAELAHYEWLELDVSVRQSSQKFTPWNGRSQFSQVQLSDLATLVSYQYPVHQISVDFQPSRPSETVFLVIYRDRADAVKFTLVNEVTALLLNTIAQQGVVRVESLTQMMIAALPQLGASQITDSLLQTLQQLLHQEILFPL